MQSKADHCARQFPREDYTEPRGEQMSAEERKRKMDEFLAAGRRITKCPPRRAAAKKAE